MNKLKSALFVKNLELENRILEFLQNFDSIEVVSNFQNEMEMLEKLMQLHPDILFLNVDLTDFDATSFLKIVPRPPFAIGVTNNSAAIRNYLDNGFFDILSPDFSLTDFCRMIGKIITIASALKQTETVPHAEEPAAVLNYKAPALPKESIILKYHRDKTRLRYEDILYIQNVGNVLKFNDVFGNCHYHVSTLVRILKELPREHFARINKSIIVNSDKIDKIANQNVIIREFSFHLSRTYAIELMERFDR